jgi:hypothetical protein
MLPPAFWSAVVPCGALEPTLRNAASQISWPEGFLNGVQEKRH